MTPKLSFIRWVVPYPPFTAEKIEAPRYNLSKIMQREWCWIRIAGTKIILNFLVLCPYSAPVHIYLSRGFSKFCRNSKFVQGWNWTSAVSMQFWSPSLPTRPLSLWNHCPLNFFPQYSLWNILIKILYPFNQLSGCSITHTSKFFHHHLLNMSYLFGPVITTSAAENIFTRLFTRTLASR